MSVNIIIITHNEIGDALIGAATSTLGELPLPTTVVKVTYKTEPSALVKKLKKLVDKIESDEGFLVLTDLYGSTPSNIAAALDEYDNLNIVSGLNLPMLIRLMNYPKLSLADLTQKALSGGRDGIVARGDQL